MAVTTARELRNRIAAKMGKASDAVSFPEYVVLYEVPLLGRGKYGLPVTDDMPVSLRSRQRIDVVAVGVWGKTRNLIHGFELKVSRADLMHELRDLTKSETAAASCDRWWLVLGDKAIMRDDDPIPESWGIMVARGRGLSVIREAAPQVGTLDRSMVVGMITRALIAPRIGIATRYRDGQIQGRKYAFNMAASISERYGNETLTERLRDLARR